MKRIKALDAEISEMEQQVKEAEQRNQALRSKNRELSEELKGVRAQEAAGHRESRQLLKEQEVKKEEEVELTGHRYKL